MPQPHELRGCWTDVVGTDDCWGYSVWGLGAMAANHPDPPIRRAALRGFNKAIDQRSQHSRSMAFAAWAWRMCW